MSTRFSQFRLVVPALVLVAVLLIALAAIPYFGVSRLDAENRQRQEVLVKRNISIWITDIEFALTAWTIWDESIAKLDNAFDLEWADRNIGSSLIGTSRTRFVAILDSDDKLIYSKTADEVQDRPFFAQGADVIAQDALSLVDKVRVSEAGGRKPGIPEPIVFSKIEVIGNDAVLLTASLFQSDFKMATLRNARGPVLISAIPIAGSLQTFLGDRFMLDDAAVGPANTVSDDRASAEIAVGPDGQAQVLSWKPLTPAHDLLRQFLPLASALTIIFIAGGIFATRTSRRAIGTLVEAEKLMRHAATHDFLTGLANRSLIATEFARLSTAGNLIVACLDLDGFKAVNDRHGHAIGDELLKQVAERLKSGCRPEDVVFRLGGDEFAVFMPGVSAVDAGTRCGQLSELLSHPYFVREKRLITGASFGLSEVRHGEVTCDDALKRADDALYRAKGASVIECAPASDMGPMRRWA
ncbi:diguanylate cyclase [Agrobacterium vaccinii]|uniref:sensor domain-containing diguanylate cyclase n=1 Tax=Agrobacterium vaccinii TaxID=2735528 RepID=UPI001E40446E|nr:diguanylate cyclase [Agrobacterium vaccinii]UHS63230.1 diguanylate cyclase [Agrobacterium vaccinii]